MSNFDSLKKYVFEEPTDDVWRNKHVFFPVSQEEIQETEELLGRALPDELKKFYQEIGYGFLCVGAGSNVNRIMSAIEMADFVLGINDYEDDIRKDYYNDPHKLAFFEVSIETFIVLDLAQENSSGQCPVYYFDKKVAESIEDFINQMEREPNYYMMI